MKIFAAYIDASDMDADELIGRARELENGGFDELIVTDFTTDEEKREQFLEKGRALSRAIDIPFIAGTYVKRFEDIKKAFYTGARAVLMQAKDVDGTSLAKEGSERFKPENIYVIDENMGVNGIGEGFEVCVLPNITSVTDASVKIADIFSQEGFTMAAISAEGCNVMPLKRIVKELGFEVNTFSTDVRFDELKTDANGLVPCIVQDYKSGEVLMMAWMDREAYEKTVETGVMTYHSRSRNELWIKGATSGHYQYLRELKLDCDSDTLLAKVVQVGAACHTGNRSCFFNELVKHEYNNKDISKVLADLYGVVCDRKVNPKEGSYTNYLFDKGIDKILKKCGEEATEMVIAAKNPNAEELKYEIADLLYHMTVLMVECGVDWTDVAAELANR